MLTAYFSDIEKVIITNLTKAKSSVKIAVAWITNPRIFSVIEKLHQQNVGLQIVVSDDKANFIIAKDNFQSLLKSKIDIKITSFPKLMHHKFCIIDNRVLITGSYNWTRGAERNNFENIILTTEKALIDKYVVAYEELLIKTKTITSFELTNFKDYSSSLAEDIELRLSEETSNEIHHKDVSTEPKLDGKLSDEVYDLLNQSDFFYFSAH